VSILCCHSFWSAPQPLPWPQALLEKETVSISAVRDAMVDGTLDSAKARSLCYEILLGVLPAHSVAWAFYHEELQERHDMIHALSPQLLGGLRLRTSMLQSRRTAAGGGYSSGIDTDSAAYEEVQMAVAAAGLVRDLAAKRVLDVDAHGVGRARPYALMAWGALAPLAAAHDGSAAVRLERADEFDLDAIARLFLSAAKAPARPPADPPAVALVPRTNTHVPRTQTRT